MKLLKCAYISCGALFFTMCGPTSRQRSTPGGNQTATTNTSGVGLSEDVGSDSVAFKSGSNGYAVYRAPTMVLAKTGAILAFAEGRVNGASDEDDIDIVMKRSTDGGRTWSPLKVLANDGKNPCKNQTPVVLPSGRILLVWLWNPWVPNKEARDSITRKVKIMHSDDHGLTWSDSRDITDSTQVMSGPDKWGWTGLGPVHGIVKQREPNKGRVILPARHSYPNTKGDGVSHVIFSDDNGQNWKIGGSVPRDQTSESTVVELSNGDVMINSRNANGSENVRVVAISKDGGATFNKSDVRLDNTLIEPRGVEGSLIFHSMNSGTGKGNILFSNPANATNRCNGTIRLSTDDGRTWSESETYAPKPCPYFTGYSDMIVFPNGNIGVLFERGDFDSNDPKGERYDEIGFSVLAASQFAAFRSNNSPQPTQPPQSVVPWGSYRLSCGFERIENGVLRAECKDRLGNLKSTQLDSYSGCSDISNDNGVMVCRK